MLYSTLMLMMSSAFLMLRLTPGGSFPRPLSEAEERKYLDAWLQGDLEARNVLIERNLRLVAHIIKKYYTHYDDTDDLISIGTIGLIKGINTYRPDKGVRLATYASKCAENEILMYFRSTRKNASEMLLSDVLDTDGDGNNLSLIDILSEDDDMDEHLQADEVSRALRRCISEVLDAREAEIIKKAGQKGSVTIATNMAGRGTDILLGGNAEFMARAEMRRMQFSEELIGEASAYGYTDDEEILNARKTFAELNKKYKAEIAPEAEEVRKLGGLYIIGTERHESRRIDNQLRGRAGRQGDPGASRFFLSLEDDLMRIFGGDRVQSLMDSLGLDEDVPIENKLITNTIESAQKKLEASNFAIRKQVLQYDDVMNQQREIIYKQRQMVLDGEDISGKLHEMMRQAIDDACTNYLNGETADDWDFAGLRRHFMNWLCLPTDFNYTTEQLGDLTKEGIADELYKRGMDILTAKEKRYGAKTMRELERICLLRNVDSKWMEHIDNMDQLKQGMGLRGYGQHDPVVEYRIEGFAMFDEMIASIREDAVHMLLTIEIRQQNAEPKREQIAKPTGDNAPGDTGAKAPAPVRVTKIGRNDPCPCGSGLKWKKCTCKEYHPDL